MHVVTIPNSAAVPCLRSENLQNILHTTVVVITTGVQRPEKVLFTSMLVSILKVHNLRKKISP